MNADNIITAKSETNISTPVIASLIETVAAEEIAVDQLLEAVTSGETGRATELAAYITQLRTPPQSPM
jgi:hypothetical protein